VQCAVADAGQFEVGDAIGAAGQFVVRHGFLPAPGRER
jgi:hypothetical protein